MIIFNHYSYTILSYTSLVSGQQRTLQAADSIYHVSFTNGGQKMINLVAQTETTKPVQTASRGKRAHIPGTPPIPSGVLTDANVIQYAYRLLGKDVQPITTSKFLARSTEVYNEAWLVREIVQNWVDHNRDHPGTLNGVHMKKTSLKGGWKRYTIAGSWSFEKITGLYAPHSDKPSTYHTAGGNGIGLKQTALRFLRDLSVSRFEIQGEGWTVLYHLARAAEINRQLQERSEHALSYRVQDDWLVAEIRQTNNIGTCAYIVETSHPTLIKVFDQLKSFGVSSDNPYLSRLDFENEHGSLSWLPLSKKQSEGRLFINGQVMNFKTKGSRIEDYWRGPEYVTIQLNDIEYTLSIDRPPVTPYELSRYLQKIVSSMTTSELIEQLRLTEYIWSLFPDKPSYSDKWGCFVVIESMVDVLRWPRQVTIDFAEMFPGKKYVASDNRLTAENITQLTKEGYILCPNFFATIGMPSAMTKLGLIEAARNNKPYLSEYQRTRIATEYGIVVAYADLGGGGGGVADFFAGIHETLATHLQEVTLREGKTTVIRLHLFDEIPSSLLTRALAHPKDETQHLLYFLRGVAKSGLERQFFHDIVLSQGEYLTTFTIAEDSIEGTHLVARNISHESDQGVFLECEVEAHALPAFLTAFRKELDPEAAAPESYPPATTDLSSQESNETEKQSPQQAERHQSNGVQVATALVEQAASQLAPLVQREAQPRAPYAQYLAWRGSEQFVAGLPGKPLMDFLASHNQTLIPLKQAARDHTQEEEGLYAQLSRLTRLIEQMNPADTVEEFELVETPSERQLAQLGLLKLYVHLSTGIAIPNDICLFKGRGSYGINIAQKVIGLHEFVLDGTFQEALETWLHELAHNVPEEEDHGKLWRYALEALWGCIWERLTTIAHTPDAYRSQEDLMLLTAPNQWNVLRAT